MDVFIDESGQFTLHNGWSVVCSLTLPSADAGRARRQLASLTRDWPKAPSGELKGGSLDTEHLDAVVDLLFRRNALFHGSAIDMESQSEAALENHRQGQCEGMTRNLTADHHPNVAEAIWKLRAVLERMPLQLYVQSVLMNSLLPLVVEQSTMYFAQRRPRELGAYKWTIDAKDPRRISTQEQWWRDTLGPLQESRCRDKPLLMVRDKAFDYQYFKKAYWFEKPLWTPTGPSKLMEGYDIGKLVTDHLAFTDSRGDILLQAIDILASFLRRVLTGQANDERILCALGRLQILYSPAKGRYQNIQVLTLSRTSSARRTQIGVSVRRMSSEGRPMFRFPVQHREV